MEYLRQSLGLHAVLPKMGVKMPCLFLALLASAAAAPATKGRPRATEPPSPPANPPKIRYVVTEEKQTNVATTKGGARAPSKVAQMADVVGGEVKKTIEAALKTLTVVEFEDNSTARAFQDQAERSGLRVEEDQQRFLATSSASASRKRQLAEGTPWGIERVYNEAVPTASFFPSAVTHPLCIIDSGYLLAHPDLPSDATAADPSQADQAGTRYFGGDICNHGTHALSAALSAAISPPRRLPVRPLYPTLPPSVPPGTHVAGTVAAIGGNGEGVVGVYPGAPDLKIVKVFGQAGLLDDPSTPFQNEACGWTWSSSLVEAVQRCVDSGAKIVSSERA